MHSKNLGSIGELTISKRFIELGYNVFTSLGDNSEIDLITEKDGKILKIQVKSTLKVNNRGVMVWNIARSRLNYKGSYKKFYSSIDAYALYCYENNYTGLIDFNSCHTTHSISLRVNKPLNNQKIGVMLAEDYIL